MIHPRKDYDHIQDPKGKIPENEPVFLLRAQDKVASRVVRVWAWEHEHEGGDKKLSEMAMLHADKMEAWPVKKLADLSAEQQGDQEQEQALTEDEIKTKVIQQHVNRLRADIKTRQQVLCSVHLFADWIKVDLSKALDCKVIEVPGKLADWMGFSWKGETTPAAEEKKPEK